MKEKNHKEWVQRCKKDKKRNGQKYEIRGETGAREGIERVSDS